MVRRPSSRTSEAQFPELGQRFDAAIKASGKSREKIAAEAGTTVQTISRIVRGHHRNLTTDLLGQLASAARTNPGYLLGALSTELTPEDFNVLDRFRDWIDGRQARINARDEPNALIVADFSSASDGIRPHLGSRKRAVGKLQIIADGPPPSEVEIPRSFWDDGARLVARASGDSMIGDGILSGDLLFVVPGNDLQSAIGRIVICRLGGNVYAKRLITEHRRLLLASANPRYTETEVRKNEIDLIGAAIGRGGPVPG